MKDFKHHNLILQKINIAAKDDRARCSSFPMNALLLLNRFGCKKVMWKRKIFINNSKKNRKPPV